jgi:hypothetical protein
MDIDAAIGENAGIAIDPANARVGGNNAFQSLSSYSGRHSVWVLPVFVFEIFSSETGQNASHQAYGVAGRSGGVAIKRTLRQNSL